MQRYSDAVQDRQGNALSGVSVLVQTEAGASATLYSDNGVTPISNPLTTNADGEFAFYAADGVYTLTFSGGGVVPETKEVQLWDYRVNGPKLAQIVSAEDYGAVGDGTTDDTAAIQAAINYLLSSGRRGVVRLGPGTYRLTSTLTVNGASCGIVGEDGGELSTILYVDHTSGPGVHLKNRRNVLRNVEITGSPTRFAAAAATNYGVLLQPDDLANRRCSHNVIDNVYIQDHPSHGVVAVGGVWFSEFTRLTIRDNKGHGMVFDNGTIASMSNKENPGIVELNRLEIFDNDGHGILIGNDNESSNRGFRFDIRNVDLYRNAESAGLRKQAAQMWAFMDTSCITISAFDGRNKAESSIVTQGLWLHGRNITVDRCRFLNVASTAVSIGAAISGFDARDIRVTGNYIFDNAGTNPSLDPAVSVDSSASNVFVDWPNSVEVARPKLLTNNAAPLTRTAVVVKQADETRNNTTTTADDSELVYALSANQRAFFRVVLFFIGDATADIKFAINGPSGSTVRAAPANSIRVGGSDTFTVQSVLSIGNTFAFGSDGAAERCCEIVGSITTGSTAGNLRVQWAQASLVAADTIVKAGSFLQVQT